MIVGILYLACLISYLAPDTQGVGVLHMVASMKSIIGSAMLLMTCVEAIDGLNTSPGERRFRLLFAGGYTMLVAGSLLADQPELEAFQDSIRVVAASIALIGASVAVFYRTGHPLRDRKRQKLKTPAASTADPVLAARLLDLIENDRIYLEPQIKVADVARRLREPEYKVSQCVVSDLNAANFNQLINSYRIEEACRLLALPDLSDRPILSIAMDCGFGSLGPFNRAFKARTGLTPSAFRQKMLATARPVGVYPR